MLFLPLGDVLALLGSSRHECYLGSTTCQFFWFLSVFVFTSSGLEYGYALWNSFFRVSLFIVITWSRVTYVASYYIGPIELGIKGYKLSNDI